MKCEARPPHPDKKPVETFFMVTTQYISPVTLMAWHVTAAVSYCMLYSSCEFSTHVLAYHKVQC